MVTMNWLDIVIIIVLAIQTFTGLSQGLIKALLGLVGLIVGIILAGRFYENLGSSLFSFISNPDVANAAAFIAILIVVWAVFSIVATILTKVVSAVFLGWVNRLGGAVFGFIMGAFFVGAALTVWAKFFGNDSLADSLLATFLLDKFPIVLGLLPSQFDSIKEFFQ
jgi:membrane protein required for colicin V production